LSEPDLVRERLGRSIDDVDATIAEIRTTIFELGASALPGGLRQGVLAVANELAPSLGARPEVSFSGAVDNTVPQNVADHVLAVVRESLTNAAKHSHGRRFVVALSVGDELELVVIDDGVGLDPSVSPVGHGLGLANLRSRAEKLQGTMSVEPAEGGGTKVTWCVPL
ncbi:MAG TPA: ATP-binding protein, partial [Acidimicrobiales bacterium]|nr:ATP-binding protein [Acidimicrobiales bacterium]